jgi:hypothetical protein
VQRHFVTYRLSPRGQLSECIEIYDTSMVRHGVLLQVKDQLQV